MMTFHIYRNCDDAPMRVPAINIDDAIEMTYAHHRDVDIDVSSRDYVIITTRTHVFVISERPLTRDLIDDIYH